MFYVSTRGAWREHPQPFCSILLEGLAPDGGLAVPEAYPVIAVAELEEMRGLGYVQLAQRILCRYIGDIPSHELDAIVARTYTPQVFGSEDITPVSTLEPGLHLLHVSNGPTLAFKDIALQLLGNLFEHVLEREGRDLNVLGATSGDTGSSAEYAMRGKQHITVFMLSPQGRMSAFQQAQMYALDDPNIHNIAIRGVFDDCQDIVKAVSSDAAFKRHWRIGTVNSINWARVAAQVVYYFKGYFAVAASVGAPVDFAVPSGNFGNILAGHVAKCMGLPIRRLVLASNENDVLDEFFRTGRYRPRSTAETHATSSPSMDISKASNFERYVFDMTDRRPDLVQGLWQELATTGEFDLSRTEAWTRVNASGLVSGVSRHADRVSTIRDCSRRYGTVIDPHTADGVKVAREYRDAAVPMVCIETALPAKFAGTIRQALGHDPLRPAEFDGLETRPQRFTELAADVEQVKAFIASEGRPARPQQHHP
ncbi:MAG: threonine synthase [Pseudomonadota bacterium]|nr:threonine synthase [Pseudomonadota bacterium]